MNIIVSLESDRDIFNASYREELVHWLTNYKLSTNAIVEDDAAPYKKLIANFDHCVAKALMNRDTSVNLQTRTKSESDNGRSGAGSHFCLNKIPTEGFLYAEIRSYDSSTLDVGSPQKNEGSGDDIPANAVPHALSFAYKGFPLWIRIIRNEDASESENVSRILFFERGPGTTATLRADALGSARIILFDCSYAEDFQLELVNVNVCVNDFVNSKSELVAVRLRFVTASDYWLWTIALSKALGGRVSMISNPMRSGTISTLYNTFKILRPSNIEIISEVSFQRLSAVEEWSKFYLHLGLLVLAIISDRRITQDYFRCYKLSGAQLRSIKFRESLGRICVVSCGSAPIADGSVIVSLNNISTASVSTQDMIRLLNENFTSQTQTLCFWKFPRGDHIVKIRIIDETATSDSIQNKLDIQNSWIDCFLLIDGQTLTLKALTGAVLLKVDCCKLQIRFVNSIQECMGGLSWYLELKEMCDEGETRQRIAVSQSNFTRAFEMLEHIMIAIRLASGPVSELNAYKGHYDHWSKTHSTVESPKFTNEPQEIASADSLVNNKQLIGEVK